MRLRCSVVVWLCCYVAVLLFSCVVVLFVSLCRVVL